MPALPANPAWLRSSWQIGSAEMMRVEHAHTVGTTQRDISLSADPLDLALHSAPVFALFREAPVVDYRALDPTLRRRDKGPENPRVAEAEHRAIGLGRASLLRHSGLAQPGDVGRLEKLADHW